MYALPLTDAEIDAMTDDEYRALCDDGDCCPHGHLNDGSDYCPICDSSGRDPFIQDDSCFVYRTRIQPLQHITRDTFFDQTPRSRVRRAQVRRYDRNPNVVATKGCAIYTFVRIRRSA